MKEMLQKKKCLLLETFAVAVLMALFAMPAKAQNVYMHTGSMTVPSSVAVNFYDSGGESHGPDYYWERWFQRNEEFTYTFNPAETGKKIKVTFNTFTAYSDNGGTNHDIGSDWSLRLNTAELSVYDGSVVNADNLITTYTGNMTGAFSVIANGPITFYFHSYGYREEGWQATVQCVDSYELQMPQISFEACSDAVVINANNKGAEIYYTTGGNAPDVADPLNGTILYEGPFNVDAGTTIKAIARLNNTNSAVASKEFTATDVTPTPGVASISRSGNTITMTPAAVPSNLNETYYVWYTTDGSEPSATNGIRYNAPFEWNIPNTTFKAVTRAETCSDKMSTQVVNLTFDDVKVPTPTITFADGNAAIACTMPGVTIYYTTDGSTPTTSSTAYTAPFAVSYGTTVKAIAVMEDENGSPLEGFEDSEVATEIYVPQGGSGADGTVVILDDREDHSWSYYSDNTSPIRSLNPADVKITYFGNGTNTVSTSNNANPGNTFTASTYNNNEPTVQVSYNETENTFIYLKTLERADGATSMNPTGNCAYTTIPNPFSKRPTYGTGDTRWRGFYGWRVKSVTGGTIQNYAVGATIPAETEIQFVPTAEYGMEVELEALWARAYVKTGNANTLDANNTLVTNLDGGSYERNFFVITAGNTDNAINLTQNPVTISNRYPDGTSGGNLTSRIQYNFTCNAATKFEYVVFRGGTNYCVSITGNGYDLVIGRGVTGYNNGICATSVYGKNGTGTTINSFNLRVESGSFTNSYLFNGNSTVTSAFTVNATYGNDYDRAKNTNANLTIAGPVEVALNTKCSSADSKISIKTLSGTFGIDEDNNELYLGFENVGTTNSRTHRNLEVLGGNFLGGISGGIEYGVDASTTILEMRIKGGTIHRYLYGAGQYAAAVGTRKTIITGGTFDAWIAGGCYGTDSNGNAGNTNGDTYIYFGGDANMTNTEGVFGGGYGRGDAGNNKYTINKSFVVVADEAQIAGNVYGGGNKGYNTDDAEVYVLGGGESTIKVSGSVFGGANQARSEAKTTVTMKDGTVTGSLYGGANASGAVAGLATVNVSGGTATNVYGGGLGASTNMASGTVVNVSNGTINNNVYGGGELGTVTGNTNVTVTGGTMKNVFGAGKGGNTTAQVSGQTFVTVTGGTISQSVYGGGENGDVMFGNSGSGAAGGSETFDDVTAAGWNAGTSYIPEGWNRYVSDASYAYTPRVSNYASYNYLQNNDGNYLLFSARSRSNGTQHSSYAIMPKYDDITAVSFKYRFRSASNGTFTVGYVTNNTGVNTFTALQTVTRTAQWTTYTLTETDINTINTNNGYIAFRFTGTSTTNSPMYSAAIDDVVVETAGSSESGPVASTVTVSGGSITGDVFGGGRMGKTGGNTEVDIKGGIIRGNVFGGAYGNSGSVYVAGTHSVNIMGGRIFSSVYGGSRNANDALVFTGYDTDETAMSSVVNISAGQVDEQVYAAGYFGQTYGSVYVFVGKEAILNAPHCAPSFGEENENMYKTGKLLLAYNVWAGSDFGTFQGGTFTAPNISGYSDIYVDGEGYDTETSNESAPAYMNIKGSLLGCGTSGDAGKKGRGIYVRNYGHANGGSKDDNFPEPFSNATRSFFSIQRADTLVIDNSHINFAGQSKINSLDATEKYAIYSFDKTVRMTGGSSLFLNAPVYQIIDFWSATVDDLYNGINAVYTPIAYNGLGATGGPIDNKIRVNGGNYIEIYHDKMINSTTPGYGMLNGFAHMMVASNSADNTCAYARPKQCEVTPIDGSLDNPDDGGWVSYDSEKNTFDIDGNSVLAGSSDQMPYENHTTVTKAGEQYFRIWRVGGMYSEREGVINAYADGTESFNYVDVTIKLPAWRSGSAYYKFETSGEGSNLNTTIDFGPDVMTYATAIASMTGTTQNWIHFVESTDQQLTGADSNAQDQINNNPNVNFGLVTLAGEGMTLNSPVSGQGGLIVCPESDQFLASVGDNGTINRFNCSDNTVEPQVTFRLTYSNQISTNMTWDPMFVTLVQCDADGNITDIVKISLTINTYTTINNVFTTQTYALMDGNHGAADTYTAKVILPTFTLHDYTADHLSEFILTNVSFEPNYVDATEQECWRPKGNSYNFTHFAMEIAASRNADNSDGWNGTATGTYDSHAVPADGILLGETGARTPFAFDFTLTYNGNNNGVAFNEDSQHPALLGVLTFTIKFTNYAEGNPNDNYSQILTIKVQVIRRGVGKVFYLDGQNGSNANSALYPNDAALSLSYIFNRCGYLPGDIIYIVNTVDVTKNLEWSGSAYNGVTIYRYPGDHPLVSKQKRNANGDFLYIDPETGEETTEAETAGVPNEPVMITPPIVGNGDNDAFTGAMVAVGDKGNLTIRDITLDGHMSNHDSPVVTETGIDAGVTAASPMITIANGGTLILTNGSMLQNNNNSITNGGGVSVADGGTLMMNQNASIMNNVTSGNGGAVYMAGTMIVSDAVQLIDNTKGTTANNVYLVGQDNVIQIGTSNASDEFGELSADAQIGVTKTLYGNVDGYTEVVKVETTDEVAWLEDPFVRPNVIIFHDGHKYELEKYNDPTYLYWIGTWVTVQDWNPHYESADVEDYNPNNFASHLDNIDTPEELAWLISYVNGYNGAAVHKDVNATITADIDMDASIWVPIGNGNTPYEGTFEGNGHIITGIHSILVNDNAAMFGVTNGATIQNVEAVVYFDGNSINKGTFIGTMNGGTLANVEAAGTLIGKANTINMGGLVGLANGTSANKSLIHSGFSVNTITAEKASTVVGGLVGSLGDIVVDENEATSNYYGDLYNSYANVTLGQSNVATIVGGLVGINNVGCTVENCYVINPINPAAVFAYTNNGTVGYCYAADGTEVESLFVNGNNTNTPVGYGTYNAVKDRKELGYMYGDNVVTAQTADTTYIRSKIVYDNKIIEWTGLLSTLNQWVKKNPKNLVDPAPWFRPTTGDINGDLPVLAFPKDNCMGNYAEEDDKFLRYSAYDLTTGENFNNGLDGLFTHYSGKAANIFLYNNATDVANGSGNANLFINEDAALLQKATNGVYPDINATVGVTFDNSNRNQTDYFGNKLNYDWHLMSTPLANAPLGISYNNEVYQNWWETDDTGQVTEVSHSYMPDDIDKQETVKWDYYCYYEPKYHWINFKRNSFSHHHFDEPHDSIAYLNEDTLVCGKGYMMAISQDSYLNNSGTLNKGDVKITLTCSGDLPEPGEPTKDWGSNLIGNPYHAYLDLVKVSKGSSEFQGTNYTKFFVYDAESGIYAPFVVNQSANTVTPSRYIHPHQGFFVLMDDASASEDFIFKYGMATTDTDLNGGSYFRGEEQINYPLVNIFAENAQGNRDLTIIEFNRPELGGAEKIYRLRNADFMISAYLENRNYAMLFAPENTEKIPVHFKASEDGTYTLRWNTENGNFTSLRLVDNITGINYDMLANDSYTFEAQASDYSTRFYITYTCTGIDEEDSVENFNSDFAFFDGSEWVINGKGRLDVVDVLGRVVYSERLYNDQNHVGLNTVAKGVYLLRVADNKNVKVQKIVVK